METIWNTLFVLMIWKFMTLEISKTKKDIFSSNVKKNKILMKKRQNFSPLLTLTFHWSWKFKLMDSGLKNLKKVTLVKNWKYNWELKTQNSFLKWECFLNLTKIVTNKHFPNPTKDLIKEQWGRGPAIPGLRFSKIRIILSKDWVRICVSLCEVISLL